MGEELLSDDRQETEKESQAPLSSPSNAVAQSSCAYVPPFYQVISCRTRHFKYVTLFVHSAKFTRKIVYIPSLPSLAAELPMDQVCIPDRVKQ